MPELSFRTASGSRGTCGVDIYERADGLIVMFTQLRNSNGIGVTNCIEELATDVALRLLANDVISDPISVRWIEHDEGTSRLPERWDDVRMVWDGRKFSNPRWTLISKGMQAPPVLGRAVPSDVLPIECRP